MGNACSSTQKNLSMSGRRSNSSPGRGMQNKPAHVQNVHKSSCRTSHQCRRAFEGFKGGLTGWKGLAKLAGVQGCLKGGLHGAEVEGWGVQGWRGLRGLPGFERFESRLTRLKGGQGREGKMGG